MAKPIVNISIMLLCLVAAAAIIIFTKDTNILNKVFFPKISFNKDDQKLTFLRSVFAYLSLIIFVPIFLVTLCRMFGQKSSPATQEDPLIIKVLNRIISNTVEQSIVFLGLFSYFLLDKAGDRFKSREIILIASWFILGRLIFAVTYFIGEIIGLPTLRTVGFALTMIVDLLLCELCFSPIPLGSPFLLGK